MKLTFLGTGGAMSETRTHSTILVDDRCLLDCSPTSLAQMKRLGLFADRVDTVFLSHFHADHTFGLPFLLLERAFKHVVDRPLVVVGPPGMAAYGAALVEMAFPGIGARIVAESKVQWVSCERPGAFWEAIPVEHCALPSYGYRLSLGGVTIGYSGDTGLCDGLYRIADGTDALLVEMNCWDRAFPGHMNRSDIQTLLSKTTSRRVILTHIDDAPEGPVPGAELASDLLTLHVGGVDHGALLGERRRDNLVSLYKAREGHIVEAS